MSNLAYVHQHCIMDIQYETEDNVQEKLDLNQIAEEVTQLVCDADDIFYRLREFFRLCKKSSVTMTFQKIEEILDDELDREAREQEAYWYDEAPGMTVSTIGRETVIADAWKSQGFKIYRLNLQKEKVTFHKVVDGVSGLKIPAALTRTKIPDSAAYELKKFYNHIIKKYGL